jgi:2'-5' RNA ligase
MHDEGGAAARLAAAVDARAAPLGVPAETRPFRPHVTLARAKAPLDARRWLSAVTAASIGSCAFTRFGLYESHLGPGGPRYRLLASAPVG